MWKEVCRLAKYFGTWAITPQWISWVFFFHYSLKHPVFRLGARLGDNKSGKKTKSSLPSKRSRKEATQQNRKLLDNNYSTLSKHHKNTAAPLSPLPVKAPWGT